MEAIPSSSSPPFLTFALRTYRLLNENTVAAVEAPLANDPAAELPVIAVTIGPRNIMNFISFLFVQPLHHFSH
jgi:hypothetical protein